MAAARVFDDQQRSWSSRSAAGHGAMISSRRAVRAQCRCLPGVKAGARTLFAAHHGDLLQRFWRRH